MPLALRRLSAILIAGTFSASCSTQADRFREPEEPLQINEATPPLCACPERGHGSGDSVEPIANPPEELPWVIDQEGGMDLPPPDRAGGVPLMEALSRRRSTREFSERRLPIQQLSELLWAAFGVNRDDQHRTAPSAWNRQEIDIYVTTEEGLFIYDAPSHRLNLTSSRDIRALTGTQGFAANAPINLIYVADFTRMRGRSDEERMVAASASTGSIAQNVYLYCASQRLATVLRGSVDVEQLGQAMELRPSQRITFAQSVGYPMR